MAMKSLYRRRWDRALSGGEGAGGLRVTGSSLQHGRHTLWSLWHCGSERVCSSGSVAGRAAGRGHSAKAWCGMLDPR